MIAPNRVYAQYRDKPKALAWYNIVPTLAAEIETAFNGIRYSYDIDNNTGQALDVIGNIVDIGRVDNDDEVYRLLLRAKIAKNNSDATLDSIVTAIQFITGIENASVDDREDMTFTVEFAEPLTDQQRNIFNEYDLIPRPQGVNFLGFVEYLPFREVEPFVAAANTEIIVGDTFYYQGVDSDSDTNTFTGVGTDMVVIAESFPI